MAVLCLALAACEDSPATEAAAAAPVFCQDFRDHLILVPDTVPEPDQMVPACEGVGAVTDRHEMNQDQLHAGDRTVHVWAKIDPKNTFVTRVVVEWGDALNQGEARRGG
jgi:hypothetical protein